ncbi:MAG: hypothetical protein JO189_00760 [Deltaproteobacteria bacterium]|nr:hypothetical protein [Deltaproteobacteria bacterium]
MRLAHQVTWIRGLARLWGFSIVLLFIAVLPVPILVHSVTATENHQHRQRSPSNCPTTPPQQAQRAGFTTLAYCLDGAAPANATLSNWVNCGGKAQANSKIWNHVDGYCDSQHIFQDVDPTTGQTVLHFRQLASDTIFCGAGGCRDIGLHTSAAPPFGQTSFSSPSDAYYEIRFRTTPVLNPRGGNPVPSLFRWSDACYTITPACNAGGDIGLGPIEVDFFETWQSNQGSAQTIDWSSGDHGFYLYSAGDIGKYVRNWSVDQQHSYGVLVTTDGKYLQQFCGYVDNALISEKNPSTFTSNCGQYDYRPGHSYSGADEKSHLKLRYHLTWWTGGNARGGTNTGPSDTYLEYIAVWACPGWQTDNTCVGNGITQ